MIAGAESTIAGAELSIGGPRATPKVYKLTPMVKHAISQSFRRYLAKCHFRWPAAGPAVSSQEAVTVGIPTV